MREFFKGWRRKAGCVTLVMACAVAGLWMRTSFFMDQFEFTQGSRTSYLLSLRSGFCWLCVDQPYSTKRWTTVSAEDARYIYGDDKSLSQIVDDWMTTKGEFHPTCGYVLYWWLILPLALLSAYLILWTPRKRTEPHHA